MLGPAVNRQPDFRRGTPRAKQHREEQPCWLAGWLAGWLPRAGRLGLARAGPSWLKLAGAGRAAGWLAGCLPAASRLAGWLTGWLTGSLSLAQAGKLGLAGLLAHDWLVAALVAADQPPLGSQAS